MRLALVVLIAWLSCSTTARAEDWTVKDKTYKNVRITKVEPDVVHITYDGGIGSVNLTDLPQDLQKRLGYDPQAALAASQRRAATQALAEAEENNKIKEMKLREAAVAKATEDSHKFETLFAFPPKGEAGSLGHTMMITATFLAQLKPDVIAVNYMTMVVEPYLDSSGVDHSGGKEISDPIAVYGLPCSFAEGCTWDGLVYPAGVMSLGADKYHVYATTKEQAIDLLEQQGGER